MLQKTARQRALHQMNSLYNCNIVLKYVHTTYKIRQPRILMFSNNYMSSHFAHDTLFADFRDNLVDNDQINTQCADFK